MGRQRVKAEDVAKENEAQAALDELVSSNQPAGKDNGRSSNGNPLPFDRQLLDTLWPGRGFEHVVNTVISDDVDMLAEYQELERDLDIKQALTAEAVRAQVNQVERNALRAHRLVVLAKVVRERYKIEVEVVMGAMRDAALASLSAERTAAAKAGEKSKQITEADIREKSAAMFPDEWREVNDRLEQAVRTAEHMDRLADLWQRRSYSLAALVQK